MLSIAVHPKHHKTHTLVGSHMCMHKHTCRIVGAHTHILTGSWVHTHTHTQTKIFPHDHGRIHTHAHANILTVHGHIHTHTQIFSQDHKYFHRIMGAHTPTYILQDWGK